MTPSADPTPLHVIMESTGSGDGISAGMAALIAAGISGVVAVLTAWITQMYSNKRHEAELAERKADRLFDARREIASRCLGAIEHYKASISTSDRIEVLRQLRAALAENGGELAILFSQKLNTLVRDTNRTINIIVLTRIFIKWRENDIRKLSELDEPTQDDLNEIKELKARIQEKKLELKHHTQELPKQFELLKNEFSKSLGTFEEPVKKDA